MIEFKNVIRFFEKLSQAFEKQTGFKMKEVTYGKIVDYFCAPKDATSLAVTRILFGLAMLFDIPDERGGSTMDTRWGDPKRCYFPLFPAIQAIPMPYMAIVYAFLWFGALGIMLGYKFRWSAAIFASCYWYLFVIEKSYWNNHSYLFGLVAILLIGTNANCCWSLDRYFKKSEETTVPYWNYFVLKYQFFILYFMAGVKKGTAEWLTGYSLQNLSEHWVFGPFKILLTVSQTDYLVVHWFAFVFDLTVAFWMMWGKTRHFAMMFCAAFHLMNIRLFRIGMFPWVCLATMPLFYPFDWPKLVCKYMKNHFENILAYMKNAIDGSNTSKKIDIDANTHTNSTNCHNEDVNYDKQIVNKENESNIMQENHDKIDNNKFFMQKKITTINLIFLYIVVQAFIPFSHFITKGYNNWTNGLYGYSWDMMVHTWDTVSVVVKIVDNQSKQEFYLDPYAWTPNDRFSRHGDMVHQFAKCVKRNLMDEHDNANMHQKWKKESINRFKDISIYIDVWCSMNGRFQQRMFNPTVDLLKAEWSPFKDVNWLMPLLVDAEKWRDVLDNIKEEVRSWNNYSDVLFVADFPGFYLENYISEDLINVTLTVLQGRIGFEPSSSLERSSYLMTSDNKIAVDSGKFHRVHNIGDIPAFYMYTYTNGTLYKNRNSNIEKDSNNKLPIVMEVHSRFKNMWTFFMLVTNSLFQIFFRVPMSIINS